MHRAVGGRLERCGMDENGGREAVSDERRGTAGFIEHFGIAD